MKNFIKLKYMLWMVIAGPIFLPFYQSDAQEAIQFVNNIEKYNIAPHAEYYVDKSKKVTIDQIIKNKGEIKFKKNRDKSMSFGYSNFAYWVSFKVAPEFKGEWFLLIDYPNHDDIRIYIPDDRKGYVEKLCGDKLNFNTRDLDYKNPAIRLKFRPDHKERIYYLRFETEGSNYFPLYLFFSREIISKIGFENRWDGIFFGIAIIIVLYSAFLFLQIKDTNYLIFTLYIIFATIPWMFFTGLLFQFLWPSNPGLNKLMPLFLAPQSISILLFGKKFLELKNISPGLNLTTNILLILCIFQVTTIVDYRICSVTGILLLAICFINLMICGIYIYVKGYKHARYLVIAFIALLMITIFFLMMLLGIFTLPFSNIHTMAISQYIVIIFMTMALGDKIKINRLEKEAAREQVIRVQEESAKTLQSKVEERTQELVIANEKLENIGDNLKRYLPPQLVTSLIKEKKTARLETERRKLTVFFSDIKSFTETTDSMEAEELSDLLNEYLYEMTAIINKHGGTLDKFVGDAIMVFFGAPESKGQKDDALRCVRMTIEMQQKMKELQEKWFKSGIEHPLQIRIGIHTGTATVGNFGTEERLQYTAIGGQVNIASRLESICDPGGILISHPTFALVSDEIECREKEKISVKGISREMLVYEVVF